MDLNKEGSAEGLGKKVLLGPILEFPVGVVLLVMPGDVRQPAGPAGINSDNSPTAVSSDAVHSGLTQGVTLSYWIFYLRECRIDFTF